MEQNRVNVWAPITPRTPEGKIRRQKYFDELEMRSKPFRGAPISPRTINSRKRRAAMDREQSIQKPMNSNAQKSNAQKSNAQNSNAESETVCNERGCWTRVIQTAKTVKSGIMKRIGWPGGSKTRRTRKTRTRRSR